jgi:hypothetical protein
MLSAMIARISVSQYRESTLPGCRGVQQICALIRNPSSQPGAAGTNAFGDPVISPQAHHELAVK